MERSTARVESVYNKQTKTNYPEDGKVVDMAVGPRKEVPGSALTPGATAFNTHLIITATLTERGQNKDSPSV